MNQEKKPINNSEIRFQGQILDNVHGFIYYTEAEEQIMSMQLFKRLQSIKQLSVVNWVFPGSEHTRYIHSLGVMHIADKMAIALGLSNYERRLLRLAGLLHDIGHYPQSHVCEMPYKKKNPGILSREKDDFCLDHNEDIRDQIDNFRIRQETGLMTASDGLHHEAVGEAIVRNNEEIRQIIIDECGNEDAPNIIADIIVGRVERGRADPLLVQIIHSELDADGIDYMMRDSAFAGTSFGSCEIDQLIRCLTVGEKDGKRILCIRPKGIAAADQYLINKFFHYSQVVCNRHITISEWMAEVITLWMRQNAVVFPDASTLKEWATREHGKLLTFTDNLFWSALERILSSDLSNLAPEYIRIFCKCLLRHDEPVFLREDEVRFITDDPQEARRMLTEAPIATQEEMMKDHLAILSVRGITKQLPLEQFRAALKRQKADGDDAATDDDTLDPELARMMECITVLEEDNETIRVLCDHPRSLMRTMYSQTLVILRTYKFPHDCNLERRL